VVKSSSDGSSMIASGDWINLPVGENLYDHVGVSVTSCSDSGPIVLIMGTDRCRDRAQQRRSLRLLCRVEPTQLG